jgi:hypothetical protein
MIRGKGRQRAFFSEMEWKAKDKSNKWGYKEKKDDYDTVFIIIIKHCSA